MYSVFSEACKMAAAGFGYENMWVKLRSKGLPRYQARVAVFGLEKARRMERREREKEAS